jgi:hypothetical protein
MGVNIALGSAPIGECPAFDCHSNGHVTVDCLVEAVNNALMGCLPLPPTETPTFLATATPTPTALGSTTFQAPTGSVSPSLVVTMHLAGGGSATLVPVVGPNCYLGSTCGFPSGYVGTYMSYVLPDGSAANLPNFHGTFFPLGSNNYALNGQACGTDSENRTVTVDDVHVTMRITCRSGRGGGCSKVYTGGTLTITVNGPSACTSITPTLTPSLRDAATPPPPSPTED